MNFLQNVYITLQCMCMSQIIMSLLFPNRVKDLLGLCEGISENIRGKRLKFL